MADGLNQNEIVMKLDYYIVVGVLIKMTLCPNVIEYCTSSSLLNRYED